MFWQNQAFLTCRFCARTVDMLVMPNTKQMASRMLDLPLPLRPVMELKLSSLLIVSAYPALLSRVNPTILKSPSGRRTT